MSGHSERCQGTGQPNATNASQVAALGRSHQPVKSHNDPRHDPDAAKLTGQRDFGLAQKLMRQAGYKDQLMRLIGPTDILAPPP